MTTMRAKLKVNDITSHATEEGGKTSETINFSAVAANGYPADGSDENNTFARFTPSADLKIQITNPALFDKFAVGEQFYVDFTKAE